jgi:serine protease DegQ
MGIGFAIPINLAKQVMESILKTGSVTRGWIGVEPQNLTSELINSLGLPTDTKGVLLSGVLEGGPADAVGVKVGDVLIEVNNQNIEDVKQLLTQVAALSPGTKSTVKVSRKNKVLTLYIEVGKRPKQKS